MSQSFAHDDPRQPQDISSAGGSLDEQLADEIADHLAAAASDLVRRGESEDQAARLALARFGDVARVTRQCWWIHKREEVMLRVVTLAVLVLLTAGVAVVGLGGWQLQRNLASRTEELSEQLATLSATQKAMLDQQRPPEISGMAYLDDRSQPAGNVEILLYRFAEEPTNTASGITTRRLRTDKDGRFESGILKPGEYSLLGTPISPDSGTNKENLYFTLIQSRPLYLTSGVGKSNVDIDLAASAQVVLAVSGVPNTIKIAEEVVDVTARLKISAADARFVTRTPVPPSDPPPLDGWPLPLPTLSTTLIPPKEMPRSFWLPPRDYAIELQLSLIRRPNPTPDVWTKLVGTTARLTTGDSAALTLCLVGKPLQERVDAAVDELKKKKPETTIDAGTTFPILQSIAKGIELKLDVATTKTQVQFTKAKLSGRIVNEDGSPATTKGWLYYDTTRVIDGQKNCAFGAAGQHVDRFEKSVPAGTVWLKYFPDNFAPTWAGPLEVNASSEINDLKLVLRKGYSCTIEVSSPDGTPIPGARVDALPVIGPDSNGPRFKHLVDEQGQIVLNNLVDLSYVLFVEAPGYDNLQTDARTIKPNELIQVRLTAKRTEAKSEKSVN